MNVHSLAETFPASHHLARPVDGIPSSVGVFFQDTLIDDAFPPQQMPTISYPEISRDFYRALPYDRYINILIHHDPKVLPHIRYTGDGIRTLARCGKPLDYFEYLRLKNHDLAPVFSFFNLMADPKEDIKAIEAFAPLLPLLHGRFIAVTYPTAQKKYVKGQLSSLRSDGELSEIYDITFPDTMYESDVAMELAIISERDAKIKQLELGALGEIGKQSTAIREEAKKKLAASRTHISFSFCLYFIANTGLDMPEPAIVPLHRSLPALTRANCEAWASTALSCRELVKRVVSLPDVSRVYQQHGEALKEAFKEKIYIPDFHKLPAAPKPEDLSQVLTINHSLKVKKQGLASAFLSFDNVTFKAYNSSEGRHTGVADALLSRPNLLGRGLGAAKPVLNSLGYEIEIGDELSKRLERKRRFFQRQEMPLHEVKGHEVLSYYDHKKYRAKETIRNPETGLPVWLKDKDYEVIPSWNKTTYEGESEPIVDAANNVIGIEQLGVRFSYLELRVETEQGSSQIGENECRADNEQPKKLDEDGSEVEAPKPWKPFLDEFIQCFGLPTVPTIMEESPELIREYYNRLVSRFKDLKPYQIDCIVRNATKKGGLVAGTMGTGKTRMTIGVLYLRNHMFNLIIVPPMLVNGWLKQLHDYGLHGEPLLTHSAIGDLRERYKKLKKLKPKQRRAALKAPQEFYITTPEFLTLGGIGNTVYDEWEAKYERKQLVVDPITGEAVLDANNKKQYTVEQSKVTCTKYSAEQAHKEAKIAFGSRHSYWDHVKECPKCKASEGFTNRGFCPSCGYVGFSYKPRRKVYATCDEGHEHTMLSWVLRGHCATCQSTNQVSLKEDGTTLDIGFINDLLSGQQPEEKATSLNKTHSVECYPAYKRLAGIFGAKAIDEIHLLANVNSQRGMSIFAIPTKETWGASGTLSRGYVMDLETSLCHVHGANTPIFPFSPWGNGRKSFREQFVTEKIKYTAQGTSKATSKSPLPEASNLSRLRRMLNCVTTTVPESVLEKEWKLPQLQRHYEPVWLRPENFDRYLGELTRIKTLFSGATTQDMQRGALQQLWALRSICDGEEKIESASAYVDQWVKEGHKFILSASTKSQYQQFIQLLKDKGIKYLAIDDRISADRREQAISAFADPSYRGLVSRTKLINIGLNNLIHACRLLIGSPEFSPDIVRQLERRIARPGQLSSSLLVVYLLVRTEPRMSVDERMLKLLLEKELAVKEMTEGKVRWKNTADLLEAAREKRGAARILSEILEDAEESGASMFTTTNITVVNDPAVSPDASSIIQEEPTELHQTIQDCLTQIPLLEDTEAAVPKPKRKRGPRKPKQDEADATAEQLELLWLSGFSK